MFDLVTSNCTETMSSLRNKKGSSGRHHSEGDSHSVRKQPNEAQAQHSSSVQSSPRYRQRKVDSEVDLQPRSSPSLQTKSPKIREDRQRSATRQDQLSPPQIPQPSSRRPIVHGVSNGISSASDSAPSPVFSPRHLSPSTSDESTTQTSGQMYVSRRSPSSSPSSSRYARAQPPNPYPVDEEDPTLTEASYQRSFYDVYKRDSYDQYNQPGGYSSLPRQFSNSNTSSLCRGSPAYSSARYEVEQKRKTTSINRHGSFHTHSDVNAHLVSPLTRRTPPRDSTAATHQHPNHQYGYNYPRKYSLPATSQQSTRFTSPGKSHSGSQLPSVRSSPYPPVPEDVGSRMSNHSTTQGECFLSDATSVEYGFPTFYSQWATENQYATTHHQPNYEASAHQYQRVSPSLSDSRSRHQSLQPDPSLMRDQSVHDIQGYGEDLQLQGETLVERTHRRSRSCDASKAQRERLVPSPYEEVKSRHQSLIRRQRPAYENVVQERITGKETGDAVRNV